MTSDQLPVDAHVQEHLWRALRQPVDLLALRQALVAGADANTPIEHLALSPLEAAVDAGSVPACAMLIEHGADINVRAVEDGRSLLHRAIASLPDEGVRHTICEFLLGTGIDPDILTEQGQSVLDWALMWGDQVLAARLRQDPVSPTPAGAN